MEKTKKVRTLYQEHKLALRKDIALALAFGFDLICQLSGIDEQWWTTAIDVLLLAFMLYSFWVWVSPKHGGSRPNMVDEMAQESLNRADGYASGTLILIGLVGVAILGITNFKVTLELNSMLIADVFFMLVSLVTGLRSGFFLLIERRYSISDEDEEA